MNRNRFVRLAAAALSCVGALGMHQVAHAQSVEPYQWKSVTIKANGFINGIVFSPAEKHLVYMYTDMGGAYRWDEPVGRWTPLNDWSRYTDEPAKHLGVEGMAADPYDANKVYMVIGTYNSPAGFCRSDDKGKTWKRTDVREIRVNGNGNGRNGGNRLSIDPNQPSHLWYGTRRDGLWHSADGAATWRRIDAFTATGDATGVAGEVGISTVLIDPSSGTRGNASRTLYTFVATTTPQKVWRSLDGGATWAALEGQPEGSEFIPIRAALTPDGQSMYITYSNNPGPNGATRGAVMKVTAPAGSSPTWTTLPLELVGNQGWSGVCIDPSDPNTLLVSTLDRWSVVDDVFRSTDAGTTWTPLNVNTHRDESSAPYAKTSKPHWIGDVQIDPHDRNRAMFTTGYGLYDTRNLAALDNGHSPHWTFFNEGFEQSAVLEFASPSAGDVYLFSAIGDRDGYRHLDFDVSPVEGTLGTSTGLSRGTSEDIDVAQHEANKLVRLVRPAPYVQTSDDNGVTWRWIGDVPREHMPERGRASIAISGDGNRIVYSPGREDGPTRGNALPVSIATRTADGWSAWTSPGSAPPAGEVLVDLAEPMTFYFHHETRFWRSIDGGETWGVMNDATPASFRNVRAVPGKAGHLIASSNEWKGIFRSTDGGKTWVRLAPEKVTNAYTVGVGAAAPGSDYPSLFLAGSANGTTGFFRSDDQGVTWVTISDDDHQFGWVTVIQGDSRIHGRLYVGSNGRGILVGDRRSN